MKIFFALLHYPVIDKNGKTVVTSITNTDIHDLSRLAKTFEIERFFLVTPLKTQIHLCQRLMKHWITGFGAGYNCTRKEAIERLTVVSSFNCLVGSLMRESGEKPVFIATSAKQHTTSINYDNMRKLISAANKSFVLLFGTGWGIHSDILKQSDYILEPIYGINDYNHLSVRCAAAIILDRLLSEQSVK